MTEARIVRKPPSGQWRFEFRMDGETVMTRHCREAGGSTPTAYQSAWIPAEASHAADCGTDLDTIRLQLTAPETLGAALTHAPPLFYREKDIRYDDLAHYVDALLPLLARFASDEAFGAAIEARGMPDDFHRLLAAGVQFASPTALVTAMQGASLEAKREVLAMLFDERVQAMYDGHDVTNACIGLPAMNIAGERSSKMFPVRRQDLRDVLVPPLAAVRDDDTKEHAGDD